MAAPGWIGRHWTGPTLIAATLMMAAPLWAVWAPGMPDYPAHFATFALIQHGTGNAIYHLHWAFVPNLASEVLVPWLARLTGLETATKLFLTAAVCLWVLGPGAVHRALYGRTGLAPLMGALFAYNANFVWGFFNYDFAAGLSFAFFAAWIVTENRKRPVRLAAFAIAVTFLYFCHVFAAAALLLMIAGFEMSQNWRLEQRGIQALARRALGVALIYLPAALAFVFLKPGGNAESGLEFNLADTMADRFESLVLHGFDDPAYFLPIALLAGLALALAWGKARIHPGMWVSLGLLFLGALLAPEWAMGGWAVHMRLPPVFAAMLFASVEFPLPRRQRAVLTVVVLAVLGWSAFGLAQSWRGPDRVYRDFIAAAPDIPRGSRLLTVLDGDAIGTRPDQPYWHMAEFAIPTRDAFTPLLFTTKGQHVVQLNPPYDRQAAASAQEGSPPDVDELEFLARGDMSGDDDMAEAFPYLTYFQCRFDIAVVVHLGGPRTALPHMLSLRRAGAAFSLYDIHPDKSCAGR